MYGEGQRGVRSRGSGSQPTLNIDETPTVWKTDLVDGSSWMVGHAEARKRRGTLQLSLIVSPDCGPLAFPSR